MKIFLDANVFIGYLDKNNHYFKSCDAFFTMADQKDIDFYTSCDLITTVYYVLKKKNKQQTLKAISEINKICKIVEFGNQAVEKAIKLMQSDGDYNDLEDTIQYILAQKSGCDLIVSNDKNFTAKGVRLLSTTEFVNEYSA